MPLDVARLRDSELASNETPEACWAAVLLWAASWHQVPAASMPKDDKWIAKTAGYALRGKIDKAWTGVRPGAMRGWIECADGRLYHPVVAEKAREAWQAKLKQRWGTECARIKKHNDRHEGANVHKPTFEEWFAAGCPQGQPLFVPGDKTDPSKGQGGETNSKRQGEGQGQGDKDSVPTGTGGEPPVDKSPSELTKAELWRAGKSLLAEQGLPVAQCGSFVGKLVTDYGDDIVIAAVRAAVTATPADAKEYLKATCQRLKGERKDAPPPVTVASNAADITKAQQAAEAARLADPVAKAAADLARIEAMKKLGRPVNEGATA
ncbi:MAG: DUF1376 domain-containing protein [Roseateles sp.]